MIDLIINTKTPAEEQADAIGSGCGLENQGLCNLKTACRRLAALNNYKANGKD